MSDKVKWSDFEADKQNPLKDLLDAGECQNAEYEKSKMEQIEQNLSLD